MWGKSSFTFWKVAPMRLSLTALSTATLAAGLMVVGAGAANAQDARQFTNVAGDVRCEVLTFEGGPYVNCVSDRARASKPECNPPNELIPSVRVYRGETHAGCWNQGLIGAPQKLGPGQIGQAHGVTVVADPLGNLHVFVGAGYAAFAGNTVGGPQAMSSASSF